MYLLVNLKFMQDNAVIHTAFAVIKLMGSQNVIL